MLLPSGMTSVAYCLLCHTSWGSLLFV
jgi:hypothetical protein